MGQFYKGTEATFLDDAMFKLPYEQMQEALKAKDTAIANTLQSIVKLNDFDIAHHAIDREDALRIKQDWENKTQSLQNQILEDPMNYKTVQGDLISMSRDLSKDIKFGDIATLGKRKSQIEEYQKSLEELYKKDPEKYAHHSLLFSHELAKTKKYKDPETGEYNYFSGSDMYAAPPMTEVVASIFKDATGKDFESLRVDENGQWKVTRGGKEEGWSSKDIQTLIDTHLKANPLLMQGYSQAISLGALPENALETAIEAAKVRYQKRTTSTTIKNELGDEQKLEIAYKFNKKKENEEQVIINTENIQKNLTNTYSTFKDNGAIIRKDLEEKKQSLIDVWNLANKNNPSAQIKVAKGLSVGEVIEKLNKLEALNPELYKFTAEKEALKDAALRNQIATSSENNYKAYLKEKGLKDTKEAFRDWHNIFSKSRPGSQPFRVMTELEATFQGTDLGTTEIKNLQSKANANKYVMPFKIGKDFSIPKQVNVNGKQQEVMVQFPVGKQDPIYKELERTYAAKKLQIKEGINYIYKGGKVYGIDTRLMDTGGTTTFEKLHEFKYIEIPNKTTFTAQNTETGAKNVNVIGNSAPSFLIAGTDKSINFEPETFAPVKGVNSSGKTYYQGTWRIGNHSLALQYETDAPNVPTMPKLDKYLQKNTPKYRADKYVAEYGGTGNLDGNIDLGNGEKLTLKNGVLYHKPSNRQGEITIKPGNELYENMMGTYMEYKMLHSK